MSKLIRLTTEDRADLVAYLDGELDDDATQRIETVLGQSGVARNDVEMLARTYELLDELPRPQVSQEFTERTMATAKLDEVRADITQTAWYRRVREISRLLPWMALLVIVSFAAFAATNRWMSREGDVLVDRLPLIQRLDVYSEVRDPRILERLIGESQMREQMRKGEEHGSK